MYIINIFLRSVTFPFHTFCPSQNISIMPLFQEILGFATSPASLAASLACLGATVLFYLCFIRPFLSPLSGLPGPSPSSFWYGNLGDVLASEGGLAHEEWHAKYGPVIAWRGLFGTTRLSTIDPKALNHILVTNAYAYPRPADIRNKIGMLTGKGLFYVEGDVHKRQRRLLAPAFGAPQIRGLEQIVYDSAFLLADKWTEVIKASQNPWVVLNAMDWSYRVALDIIGVAGLGYHFDALEKGESGSKIGDAINKILKTRSERLTPFKVCLYQVMRATPKWLHIYKPPMLRTIEELMETIQRECRTLLAEKKLEAASVDSTHGKDLISILLRANAAVDVKDRLDDDEVLGQMITAILAGHETTATAMGWLWLHFARNPDIQTKLRREIRDFKAGALESGHYIPFDELNSLPYLDAVCREILRLFSPVVLSPREATCNDIIPIEKGGFVRISRGEQVMIPISAFNRSQELFGPDANSFRPERWLEDGPQGSPPSLWSGMMTFMAGPRACIGYRLALMEMKVSTAVLVSRFHLEERDGPDGGPEIERGADHVIIPEVKGQPLEPCIPLRISLL
ncbi:hypothetical protein CROQUDRAFT_107103 [Cronartium quercuum f. sp. fusiforme G11]|uniref:Cytochrome P450 n=1 Tax=Cronartium quercuum f. sp. fusiforme G11 TaxID=708437 RepID=A0A9P6NLQ7_9BASI|nr:hypothetical protein CROQUDRAFT_107103 [Cronartium quercuum f. sp. fusiforme G11]